MTLRPSEDFRLVFLSDLKLLNGTKPEKDDYRRVRVFGSIEYDGFTILDGFVSDGASIPRIFWWWRSPWNGPHKYGALFHDALYAETHESKEDCDLLFQEINLDSGAKRYSSWIMYQAVKRFGNKAFSTNRKKLRELGPGWRHLR